MNRTNGKIADQSRQAFARALLTVMEQYHFKEITVTQLAQQAQLSRKTFYRLFPDKEAVLKHYFDGLFEDCLREIRLRELHSYWEVMQLYFDFWESRRETLALLDKSGLLPSLFDYAYKRSLEVFISVRSQETAQAFSMPLPYLLSYSVGGMHCMLQKWVEDGMTVPYRELIEKLKAGFSSALI